MARSASRRGQSGSLTDRLPLKQGAIFGAAAYVVGYILTYVLVSLDDELDTSELEGEFADTPDLVGWVFYNSHFVDTEFSVSFGGESETQTESIISETSTQIPEVIYYLVPIALLVGAGYLVMQQNYAAEVTDAALSGAAIVAGYLPLAVIGTFVFTASESVSQGGFEASTSVGPDTATAIILAGILFPLALGAVGGFVAFQTQDNRRGSRRM